MYNNCDQQRWENMSMVGEGVASEGVEEPEGLFVIYVANVLIFLFIVDSQA